MKVVILCGGMGTRLAEETALKPKPMVEIGGKPILWHIMKTYAAQGFQEFVLALGYKGDLIKSWFHHYRLTSSDFTLTLDAHSDPVVHARSATAPWTVTCVDTGESTLKGGRVARPPFRVDSPVSTHVTVQGAVALRACTTGSECASSVSVKSEEVRR